MLILNLPGFFPSGPAILKVDRIQKMDGIANIGAKRESESGVFRLTRFHPVTVVDPGAYRSLFTVGSILSARRRCSWSVGSVFWAKAFKSGSLVFFAAS